MAKKKRSTSARTARAKKSRVYDNSARFEKSQQTQKVIIESLVALLVERRGGDVQFDEVAKKSGVSERTIFRFFKDKEALLKATDTYLQSFVAASVDKIQEMDVSGFAKNSFILFDEFENLTMAYLYSPFGQQARALFRKKLHQLLISKISEKKKLQHSREEEVRLALTVSLVNAKIWDDLRTDFGFSGREIGEAVAWSIQHLLEHLND